MPTPLTALPAALRRGPFTSADAVRHDLGRGALRGRAVRRLHRDAYVVAEPPATFADRVAAARLVLPVPCAVGGVTALQLWGLDLGPAEPLRFWTDWPHQVRRPGLRVTRVAELTADGAALLPAAVFRTAATDLGLVDLVAAGDWLVRRRLATLEDLQEAAQVRGRGAVRSRRAAELVRPCVDSPRETWLRLLLVLAGLPEPETNVAVRHHGRLVGTPDLLLEAQRTVLEYEGDHHRLDREQWAYDLVRYEQFAAAGHTVIRVSADHARRPRALVARIERTLRSRGLEGPGAVLSAEWCAAFGRLGAQPPFGDAMG